MRTLLPMAIAVAVTLVVTVPVTLAVRSHYTEGVRMEPHGDVLEDEETLLVGMEVPSESSADGVPAPYDDGPSGLASEEMQGYGEDAFSDEGLEQAAQDDRFGPSQLAGIYVLHMTKTEDNSPNYQNQIGEKYKVELVLDIEQDTYGGNGRLTASLNNLGGNVMLCCVPPVATYEPPTHSMRFELVFSTYGGTVTFKGSVDDDGTAGGTYVEHDEFIGSVEKGEFTGEKRSI